jgi:acetyl esterase/lipase
MVGGISLGTHAEGFDSHLAGRIEVTPDTSYFDRPLHIHIQGLEPGENVIVRAETDDAAGQHWTSEATFIADDSGAVDPARQAPLSGSYTGVHPTGLLWSMVGARKFHTSRHLTVHLTVLRRDEVYASRSVTRLSPQAAEHIHWRQVRGSGFVADLFSPAGASRPLPVVVVLGGSGGGFHGERAALVATHGYAVLDLAYFGVDGVPDELRGIPLEYFIRVIDWLQTQPGLDPKRIAVMGKSKGAELALVLASHEPRLRAVVSEQPASMVWAGIGARGYFSSSWTYEGAGLPFVRGSLIESMKWMLAVSRGEKQIDQLPYTQSAFHDVKGVREATIRVERIQGAVLLISGEDDHIWSSTKMSESIMTRLREHNHAFVSKHVHYPEAGHNLGGGEGSFGVPRLPPKDRSHNTFIRGGTRQGNSVAAIASWQEIIAFLKSNL